MKPYLQQYARVTNYVTKQAPPTLAVNLRRVACILEGHEGKTCWLYIEGRQEHVTASFAEVRDTWLAANGEG